MSCGLAKQSINLLTLVEAGTVGGGNATFRMRAVAYQGCGLAAP